MMQHAVTRPGPRAIAIAALAAAAASVQAQETTLETVVVTAAGREQAVKDAPASVSVITREELEKKPYTNLREVLNGLEGVSVVGYGASETDIMIRGMPAEYTLFLVDGKRQGTRETMNRGTSGVQSNLLPPLAAIERIEVVRGPMSSLYGSDAIGGVINIITRKVPAQWGGSVSLGGVWQERGYLGDSRQGEFWVGGPIQSDVLGLSIQGKSIKRDEDDYFVQPPGATSAAVYGALEQKDESLSVRLTAKPTANQDIALEVGKAELTLSSSTDYARNNPAALAPEAEHARDWWSVTHNGRWGGDITTTLALQQETGTQTKRNADGSKIPGTPEIVNTVLDGLMSLPLGRNLLKVGVQFSRNELTGIAREAVVAGYPANTDDVSLDSKALFVENEFFATDNLTLTAGLRMDDHDNYGQHWTPRLYGVYHFTPQWTLRGGVAKGFKAPTIRQSTAGYCMTTGASTGRGSLCGNPDLEPETSVSSELGLRFDDADRSFSVTLFNSDFKDKVASYDTGEIDPLLGAPWHVYIYDNIDEVTLRGVELGFETKLAPTWRIGGHYTYTDSQRKGGEPSFDGSSLDGHPLDKTPEHVFNVQLDWTPTDALNLYARANYTGKQYWAAYRNGAMGVREREASTTLDLGGGYAINKFLSVKFAVLNVTDRVVAVDERGRTLGLDGNWMLDEGRRVAMTLDARF
ncbi:TonB-dependent receptor domain-containing protein [Pseudothauera rhizosphaerae]|uniref:TonB-dependent receptor n=1 Tax=Pseudothauera rhizosphaerae TaxID=2565932 RepID=A0A4S4B0F3_9RHOO|nr:TonB-dependent receptor [Pseudothauera rhizosphaerae]THF65104.1 TonB-dependent receptor [Pseudothauera rhizosphaerae]